MRTEIAKLKKEEIIWLIEHSCKHRHSYLEHFSCYPNRAEKKILYIDIEISPSLGFVYGKYDQNVIKFKKEWEIMCVGYKWSTGKVEVVSGKERHIVKKIRDLLDEADLVIGQNLDRFDIRKINTRIAFFGLKPPSKYKTLDTLKKLRRLFGLNSNSLNDAGEYFGLGVKKGSYKDLWEDCLKGDKKAWQKMRSYNAQDVLLLEKLYKKIEPWL